MSSLQRTIGRNIAKIADNGNAKAHRKGRQRALEEKQRQEYAAMRAKKAEKRSKAIDAIKKIFSGGKRDA